MLTTLSTIRARLAIAADDTTNDALLTNAIAAVSARFDRECRRTFARTVAFCQEFDGASTEIVADCYPVETVTKFELKASEAEGWVEQDTPGFLIRGRCIITLHAPFSTLHAPRLLARVTYTGGYRLPGSPPLDPPVAVCQELPADLEQAAVEQVAFWFQTRDHAGVLREWPKGGTYEQFADLDLLPSVRAVLRRYERYDA